MAPSNRVFVAALFATSCALAGCPTTSPLDADTGLDADADLDASIDRPSSLDTSPCTIPDAGDACNSFEPPGVFIVRANVAGTPRLGSGRVIADGRYALSRVDNYVFPPGSQPDGGDMPSTDQEIIEVCGSTLTRATWSGAGVQRQTYQLEFAGPMIGLHEVCPMVDTSRPFPMSYAVNADGSWSLVLSFEGYASVSTYVPLR